MVDHMTLRTLTVLLVMSSHIYVLCSCVGLLDVVAVELRMSHEEWVA